MTSRWLQDLKYKHQPFRGQISFFFDLFPNPQLCAVAAAAFSTNGVVALQWIQWIPARLSSGCERFWIHVRRSPQRLLDGKERLQMIGYFCQQNWVWIAGKST